MGQKLCLLMVSRLMMMLMSILAGRGLALVLSLDP